MSGERERFASAMLDGYGAGCELADNAEVAFSTPDGVTVAIPLALVRRIADATVELMCSDRRRVRVVFWSEKKRHEEEGDDVG